MEDSSSGEELGEEGGSFRGLFDSIEVRRHRVGAPLDSIVYGIRRNVSALSLRSLLPAPQASPVGGAVEGGLDVGGADGPVIGGCLASVVCMEAPVIDDCLDSVAGGDAVLGVGGAIADLGVVGASDPVAGSPSSVVRGDASGCVSSSAVGVKPEVQVCQLPATTEPLTRGPTRLPALLASGFVPVRVCRSRIRDVLDAARLSSPAQAAAGSHRPAIAAARPVMGKGNAVRPFMAFKLWKSASLVDVRTLDNGFFVFVFVSVKARDDVLEHGPWFFLRTPIFFRRWERMLSLSKEKLARVQTASGSRLAFTRVCVEIDALEDFIYEIPVTLGSSSCLVRLRYPWLPPRCGVCVAFGHETSSCASCRSTVPDACVPTTSLHGSSQPSAHVRPGSTLMPHAGRTEGGGGSEDRGRSHDRTGRVSRERSVPRQLRGTRARSLSSGLSPETGPLSLPGAITGCFMTSFAAWNVRGLNLVPRQREVRDLCAREGIVLCGLLKSKIIHCEVRHLARDVVFEVSFVYVRNEYSLRTELWASIGSILDVAGCQFTWSNHQQGPDFIATNIDRVLVNDGWLHWFPLSSAFFLQPGTSDHSPGLVTMGDHEARTRRLFRFFSFLTECDEFLSTGLLGSPHERRYSGYGSLDSFIRTRLSATQQEELSRDVIDEEVSAVFKSLSK
ncbi:hypothetical protein Dimus_035765, partial [Dionaea muscipula]